MKHFKPFRRAHNVNRRYGFIVIKTIAWKEIKGYFPQLFLICLMASLVCPTSTRALTIIPTFDTSITADPQAAAIEATINSAIAVYEADFSDPITVSFDFQEVTNGLAGSTTYYVTVAYSDYLTALTAHATSADDETALAHLPPGPNNPVNGNTRISLNDSLARALGFSANPPEFDSSISLNISSMNITSSNPDTNKYSLFAAVSHEMDEGLAFGSGLNGLTNGAAAPTDDSVAPEDLFRYAQNGARSWTTDVNAAAYFSLNGINDLAQFNQHQGGDFADWYSYYGGQTPQVQDANGTPGAFPVLGVELRVLDAIGLTYASSYKTTPVWVDFNYSTSSPQLGTYANPYSTLAQGTNAVTVGGTIAINGVVQPSASHETMKITKSMQIISVNGPSIVGY
jgi:hypothetical protein